MIVANRSFFAIKYSATHITNQRTFEVLCDLGVEAQAEALIAPADID